MPTNTGPVRAAGLPDDIELFRKSQFLASLVSDGSFVETHSDSEPEGFWAGKGESRVPSIQEFRRWFRRRLDDPENALLALRRLRVRTLLALARADLGGSIKPHQLRSRLKALSESIVQGAWWVAEASLRQRFVHPLILERRNINPPLAICSLSRLGAGEPWYTTGPSPIFIHSRAAEFAPALTEKDFEAARRSGKEWVPAREYFHSLARRTMSYLSVPDPAGKGYEHMAEDLAPDHAVILPGALVVLFSAFEEHFSAGRPIKERLALMRLRFLVGQDRLGRAVEAAARDALLKTALELGVRLRPAINAWYRERAKAERLPLVKGGLLDIERGIRIVQFRHALDDSSFLNPSPLKSLEILARQGILNADERMILHKAYSWQWFLANRLSLFGRRTSFDWEGLRRGRIDVHSFEDNLGLPGAAERTVKLLKAAKTVLTGLTRETRKETAE